MKNAKKLIAVILSLAMVFSLVSSISYAAQFKDKETKASLSFNTFSDPHFYPQSLTGNNCEEFQELCASGTKLYYESEAIVRTALDTMLIRNPELKYILIPGDLTKDSEYEAHLGFAAILKEYEEKYGVEFLVTTGNHDINQEKAATFVNGTKEPGTPTTADQFRDIYADFGYDLAIDEYAEKGDNVQGWLSYAADLLDDYGNYSYRLIVIDSCIYSFDEPSKETGGTVTEELMQWVKGHADDAKAKGMTPMVMLHHGLAAHMETEPSITFAFPLYDYMDVAERFADWGIHYAFSGHLHTNDVAATVNDNGEVLYDCETASLAGYPFMYREMTIKTYTDGESEISFDSVDFDNAKAFTFDGVTYEKGTYKNEAFFLTFCRGGADDGTPSGAAFVKSLLRNIIRDYAEKIRAAGSITAFLKETGIDLERILSDFLSPYIGDGFKIGELNIFSVDNLMWFIDDLLGQVYDLYIEDEEALIALADKTVDELMSIEVSQYPCDKFIDTLGFGDRNKAGTLSDLLACVFTYWYSGDEDISDDKFMTDAINNFENGDLTKTVFNTLVDVLLHDLVEDSILAKLEIRVYKLLCNKEIMDKTGKGINYLLSTILKKDITYMNLIDTVFGLGVLPYESIYDILDKELMQKYLTDSQFESIGIFIAYILKDFCTDENPVFSGDSGEIYSSERITPEVTRENYRLPTSVTVTMGEDSSSEAFITWHSKSTVGGDIEIYRADSEPLFTGEPTENADFDISLETESVTRSFPGIDLGFTGFLDYEFKMNKHTATLSGLEKGETYYFRVGDAERDWWSETGSVTTADGSKDVTFLHLTDPQSQNERQYTRAWATVLEEAEKLYDSDFILNTGDIVDHGNNSKQWAWALDTGSAQLMNTFMMPASGNHEGYGTNATANYFTLPGMPEQDTASGVYYSFDYNNIHIAVLNTEDLDENEALTKKQLDWLREDMTASDAQWKFVALHKAVYSQGSHYADEDVCAIRDQLKGLMNELDIDMVFQGHDHVYMRTGSLVNNRLTAYEKTYLNYKGDIYRTQVLPEGTTYVISGTSGVKTYLQNDTGKTDKYFPRGEKILSVDAPMFSSVEIVDGILYFNAYTVTDDGAVSVDRFAIQKDITQGTVEENYTEPEDEQPSEENESFIAKFIKAFKKIISAIMNMIKLCMPSVKC